MKSPIAKEKPVYLSNATWVLGLVVLLLALSFGAIAQADDPGCTDGDCPPDPGCTDGGCGATYYLDIDIKPGSDPNCFNNDGKGVIPVVIFGSADFSVTRIDPSTVTLEDLQVKAVGKSDNLLASLEDVDGDGFVDLVVQIQDEDGAFTSGTTTAILRGQTKKGNAIEGADTICIVP